MKKNTQPVYHPDLIQNPTYTIMLDYTPRQEKQYSKVLTNLRLTAIMDFSRIIAGGIIKRDSNLGTPCPHRSCEQMDTGFRLAKRKHDDRLPKNTQCGTTKYIHYFPPPFLTNNNNNNTKFI